MHVVVAPQLHLLHLAHHVCLLVRIFRLCRLENAEVRVGSWPITTSTQAAQVANNALCWKLAGKGANGVTYDYACNGGTPLTGQYVTVQNFQNATACLSSLGCALQVGTESLYCVRFMPAPTYPVVIRNIAACPLWKILWRPFQQPCHWTS